jgi:dTDP-4-amino-4,6-dideoxygalactose transaminase
MTEGRELPYGRQWISEDDLRAVERVLGGAWLTTGPAVEEFERALALRGGVRAAVAVNSGTAALHSAYFAAGLSPGDELITSPLTFVATASVAVQLGARVRFCDVDARTGNLDPERVEEAVGERTRLLVPVDYAGHPADYDRLAAIAGPRELGLVADAAHSFGATYRGRPVGSLADATTTSFHPVKLITTAEGGALLTDREDWQQRALEFRNHGIVRADGSSADEPGWHYEIRSLGLNYRIPDVLCALGLSQLSKMESFLARRREIASRYMEAFADLEALELPAVLDGVAPAWHLFVVRVRDAGRRRALFDRLRSRGMRVQVHYIPVYLHEAFRALGYQPGLCPVAEAFAQRALSLPIFPGMSESDLAWSIDTILEAAAETL